MKYIADLHIHSPYSRATSKTSHLFGLAAWASVKGIKVIGTGDFTHPGWFGHLLENLVEAEPGFYRLRQEKKAEYAHVLPDGLLSDTDAIRFVLTAEVSSIYKRGGRVRKVHNIIFAPDFASVRRLNATLAGIGNIESDGRPILGLDSRDLLEIVLEKAPEGFLVPAHIWTPWFSLFGSKSGFDAIEECFGDLSGHIFALETGLSSDPDMNRHISALDRFTLISNSDCHSPGKLGREANIFSTGLDFFAMKQAVQSPVDDQGKKVFEATIEFYPEEGKYHCDGHRKCKVCLEPLETNRVKGICPVCGRPVTVGVLNRVMELADRAVPVFPHGSPDVYSLVPLAEILGELLGTGSASKKVTRAYARLINQFGTEFDLLLNTPVEDISGIASPVLAEAIQRVRTGNVIRKPGYDGEFGVIHVFSEGERSKLAGQLDLYGSPVPRVNRLKAPQVPAKAKKTGPGEKRESPAGKNLNPEQERVVNSHARHIIVKAGPGTGKTHTLVRRVIKLVQEKNTSCTVITFTNKSVDELKQRLNAVLGEDMPVYVATLHGYCLHWLRQETPDLAVAGPDTRLHLLKSLSGKSGMALKELDRHITLFLQESLPQADNNEPYRELYINALDRQNQVDIDAVIPRVAEMLKAGEPAAARMRWATGALFIDEFQDLNRAQYELVALLAETSPVFAIGDPDQAIYGFRGSSPYWFSRFIEELKPEVHVLYRNYRSASRIVNAAHEVILHNHREASVIRPKSAVEKEGAIFLQKCASARAEAGFIVRQIELLVGGTSHREVERLKNAGNGNFTLSDIAVLYRTSRQAKILAEVLSEHGFPVQVVDITPFYRSGPARFLYLWTLAAAGRLELSDMLSLLKLEKRADAKTLLSLEQKLSGSNRNPLLCLDELRAGIPVGQFELLEEAGAFSRSLQTRAENGVDAMLHRVVTRDNLDAEDPEILRFYRLAENYGSSLEGFAEHLLRYNDSVVYDDRAEAVALMTIHAAKGLEFPVVFIVGAEEGLLPLAARGDLSPEEMEAHVAEERRLFYVGITRAERILYLLCCENRQVAGEMIKQEQSRFIREMPENCFSAPDEIMTGKKPRKRKAKQLSLF